MIFGYKFETRGRLNLLLVTKAQRWAKGDATGRNPVKVRADHPSDR